MPKYTVEIAVSYVAKVEVEAKTEKRATCKAIDMYQAPQSLGIGLSKPAELFNQQWNVYVVGAEMELELELE